jgi:single-strand DNA-binding protein
MASFNNCTFVGNLGKDPELRYTPSGKAVCDFTLAVNEKFGDKQSTVWLRVTCWDKTADNAAKYLEKGSPVLVAGPLSVEEWEGRDGKRGTTVGVTAHRLVFLSSGDRQAAGERERDRDPGPRSGGQRPGPAPGSNKAPHRRGEAPPVEEDDIPF